MDVLERLDKRQLKEILVKNWMTHDAMWLIHCMQECGLETMNKVNLAAVSSMAAIEMRRIRKALGITKEVIDSFDEAVEIARAAFDIVKGDFMNFRFHVPQKNILGWEWEKEGCFAYQGIRDLGLLDGYACGVMRRIEVWLDVLGVEYEMHPRIDKCIMAKDGTCRGEFRTRLK